ncbi:MAG: phage tail protein [Desulfobacterales bacterium]|nr:phage tail protein [Desulfobacterales bacterium]
MIGTFGKIVFEASSTKVLTFEGFTRKGSAEFAEHPVLDDKPRLQHTGAGLDEISFSVLLDASLGISPLDELDKFREAKELGESNNLIIGSAVVGRFVIREAEDKWPLIDGQGRVYKVLVNLTLKEDAHGN